MCAGGAMCCCWGRGFAAAPIGVCWAPPRPRLSSGSPPMPACGRNKNAILEVILCLLRPDKHCFDNKMKQVLQVLGSRFSRTLEKGLF